MQHANDALSEEMTDGSTRVNFEQVATAEDRDSATCDTRINSNIKVMIKVYFLARMDDHRVLKETSDAWTRI